VGPRAGLDGCEKISPPHRDLIPVPSFVARRCASSEKHGSVREKYSNKVYLMYIGPCIIVMVEE